MELPEKLHPLRDTTPSVIAVLNQLIDCVAELRKEREKKLKVIWAPSTGISGGGRSSLDQTPVTTIEESVKAIKILAMKAGSFGRTWDEFGRLVKFHLEKAQDQRTAEIREMIKTQQRQYSNGEDDYSQGAYEAIEALLTSLGNKSV